jgi:hypothetical protein
MGNQIYFTIAGHVDLDKLNMLFRSTNKYGRQGQFLFLIGYCLKKSSPLKLLGKMEPNLAGSIYVRSSIKLLLSIEKLEAQPTEPVSLT